VTGDCCPTLDRPAWARPKSSSWNVRAIVLEQVRPFGDVKIDVLGNVLLTRLGQGPNRLRVMLAAHMDEVGLMLTNDEGEGIFRFDKVGGIDVRWLAAKPLWVGSEHVPAVIGAKPIHLTTDDELKTAFTLDGLRVDISPGNASKVKVGDRATFASSFSRLGRSLRGKALDDRLGVATLIELVKHAPTNIDLLAAFTVQEEVGLRGARVAAYALDPQIAVALDCTPANDLPPLVGDEDAENTRYNTRLGAGPAIYVADAATIGDPRLVRHFVETAEAAHIPYQIRQPGGGATDAGAIHMQRAGIPSLSVSVPGRYLHTPLAIARLDDWKNTLALVYQALVRLTPQVLESDQ
jgi:putative aminopeptidase FrvX